MNAFKAVMKQYFWNAAFEFDCGALCWNVMLECCIDEGDDCIGALAIDIGVIYMSC